jgi:hypothetical protein
VPCDIRPAPGISIRADCQGVVVNETDTVTITVESHP